MITYLHRCMIVPKDYAPTVRALCSGMGPGGSGGNMFTVGLSASGELPATHFISAGAQGDDFCGLLPLTRLDAKGVATTAPGQPATIVYLAGKAGITVTKAQIDAVLAAVEITTDDWEAALIRRGLKTIQGVLA